jgi:hypothetical protein
MSSAEMRRELRAFYGQNVMNEGTVRQWHSSVHDEERSGWSSVVSDKLVRSVERRGFTISELSCEFLQI